MKWRECRNREVAYWRAQKGGQGYIVRANWRDPLARKGKVVWWAVTAPRGANKAFRTKEAAMAYCERVAAGVTP